MITAISLPRQNPDLFFLLYPKQELPLINERESIKRFEEEWIRRVRETFPNAIVDFHNYGSIRVVEDEPSPVRIGNTQALVQAMGEELFHDGELWLVRLEDTDGND